MRRKFDLYDELALGFDALPGKLAAYSYSQSNFSINPYDQHTAHNYVQLVKSKEGMFSNQQLV